MKIKNLTIIAMIFLASHLSAGENRATVISRTFNYSKMKSTYILKNSDGKYEMTIDDRRNGAMCYLMNLLQVGFEVVYDDSGVTKRTIAPESVISITNSKGKEQIFANTLFGNPKFAETFPFSYAKREEELKELEAAKQR